MLSFCPLPWKARLTLQPAIFFLDYPVVLPPPPPPFSLLASRPCAPRLLGKDAMVCVCNATYCDTIDSVSLPPVGSFLKYETSQDGLRMELSKRKMQLNRTAFGQHLCFSRGGLDGGTSMPPPTKMAPAYHISPSSKGTRYTFNPFIDFQRIKGFGGSLTDAAAINILRLSPATQKHLLRSYFSEEGEHVLRER